MYSSFLFCLNMDKFKYIQIVLFGFLILKESSTHPLQNEKKCSPASQAQNEQFPYTVFLRMHSNGEILCQGTLVDVNWILTSAHCINTTDNIPLNDIDFAMRNDGTHETILKPIKVIESKYNDVALIEMENAVNVTSMVAPIELADEDQLSNNAECIVTSFKKQPNNDLSLVYWNVVNISKQSYGKSEWYLEDTICHSQIWNSLQNITDNGTPLVCNNHLYGIYSLNEPKIFNNIFKYKNWIRNVINPITSNKKLEIYANSFKVNNNLLSDTNSTTTDGKENDMNDPSLPETEATPANSEGTENTLYSDPSTKNMEGTTTSWPETSWSESGSSSHSTHSFSSTTFIESSTAEKSTSSPTPLTTITRNTEKNTKTYVTADKLTSEPSVSQSSTTDKFTTTSNPPTTLDGDTEDTADTGVTEQSTAITELTTEYTETTIEETGETEETPGKPSSEPSVSQSPTTEKYTTTSNHSTTITGETTEITETEITELITETTEETEETTEKTEEPTEETTEETDYSAVTQSSTTEVTTSSPKPTTPTTEGTVATDQTEDGPYSDIPGTHRPVTQSSTTEVTTLRPKPTDITTKKTTTEPATPEPTSPSEHQSTEGTKITDDTDGTPATYHDIPTIATTPSSTPEGHSSPAPNTTVSDHGYGSNTTTTTVSTTTGISTEVTHETTTFVDEQYKDKSCSQTISVHTSLITIVLILIVYHINL